MDRWKKLGNDADGRRSETFGGHEMTLQEQIQQSMDAEASQVPVELLHNWIDRRNRNSRTANAAIKINQQQQQANPRQSDNPGSNTSNAYDNQQQQTTTYNNSYRDANWQRSSGGDLIDSRTGGAATTLTTITTTTPTKSQSQNLQSQDDNNNNSKLLRHSDIQMNQNANNDNNYDGNLVNFKSSPSSPEIQSGLGHMQTTYQNEPNQHQHQPVMAGHAIELKITNASVNSDENLDFFSTSNEESNPNFQDTNMNGNNSNDINNSDENNNN